MNTDLTRAVGLITALLILSWFVHVMSELLGFFGTMFAVTYVIWVAEMNIIHGYEKERF